MSVLARLRHLTSPKCPQSFWLRHLTSPKCPQSFSSICPFSHCVTTARAPHAIFMLNTTRVKPSLQHFSSPHSELLHYLLRGLVLQTNSITPFSFFFFIVRFYYHLLLLLITPPACSSLVVGATTGSHRNNAVLRFTISTIIGQQRSRKNLQAANQTLFSCHYRNEHKFAGCYRTIGAQH